MRCKITTFSGKTKQNDEKTPQWVLFRGRFQKIRPKTIAALGGFSLCYSLLTYHFSLITYHLSLLTHLLKF